MKAPIKKPSTSTQNISAIDQTAEGINPSFRDNRPEAISQQKLQEKADQSLSSKPLTQLQVKANAFSGQSPVQKQENKTGLPDQLKSGVENLSGTSMDDVKVHYNSDKPAQLNAHAYAQGTDIHLGPGQEKHLPHEAWHVVQQKQGRVQPTMQMKEKVNINDDAGLEQEADVMGQKALQMNASSTYTNSQEAPNFIHKHVSSDKYIQRKILSKKAVLQLKKSLSNILWNNYVSQVIQRVTLAEFEPHQKSVLEKMGFDDSKLHSFSVSDSTGLNDLYNHLIQLNAPPYGLTPQEIMEYLGNNVSIEKIKETSQTESLIETKVNNLKTSEATLFQNFFDDDEELAEIYLSRFSLDEIKQLNSIPKKAEKLKNLLGNSGLKSDLEFDQILRFAKLKFDPENDFTLLNFLDIDQLEQLNTSPLNGNQIIELCEIGASFDEIKAIQHHVNDLPKKIKSTIKARTTKDINFSESDTTFLYDQGFSIQEIYELDQAIKGISNFPLPAINYLISQRLKPSKIVFLAKYGCFDDDFINTSEVSKLDPIELANLTYGAGAKLSFNQVKMLTNKALWKNKAFEPKQMKMILEKGIPIPRIEEFKNKAFSPAEIIKLAPLSTTVPQLEKYKTEQGKKVDWILTKGITDFDDAHIDELNKSKKDGGKGLSYESIQNLKLNNYSYQNIEFLINNKYTADEIIKLNKANISFDDLKALIATHSATKELIFKLISGFTKDNLVHFIQNESLGFDKIIDLLDTKFSFDELTKLKAEGFSYDDIIHLRTETNLSFDKIINFKKEGATNLDDYKVHEKTNYSLADIHKFRSIPLDTDHIIKFSETKYTYDEIKKTIDFLSGKYGINTIDEQYTYLLKLSKTSFTAENVEMLLGLGVAPQNILALAETRFTAPEIKKDIEEGKSIDQIIFSNQSKFDPSDFGTVYTTFANKDLGKTQKLATNKFNKDEIIKLKDLGFDIDQLLKLGEQKFSFSDVKYLIDSHGFSKQDILTLSETGYSMAEFNNLLKKIPLSSDIEKLKVIIQFGANAYSFEEAMSLLGDQRFKTLAGSNFENAETLLKSYSFEQILFLLENKNFYQPTDSHHRILTYAQSPEQSVKNIHGRKNSAEIKFDIRELLFSWFKLEKVINEGIKDWEQSFAFPQYYDDAKEAIEGLIKIRKEAQEHVEEAKEIMDSLIKNDAPNTRYDQVQKILELHRKINTSYNKLTRQGGNSPAMSALGRAKDRDGEIKEPTSMPPPSSATTDIYHNIKIGAQGKHPESSKTMFDPETPNYEAPKGVLTGPGVGSKSVPITKRTQLTDLHKEQIKNDIQKLAKPNDPNNKNVVYDGPAKRVDRGAGQANAMAGYNAATYAFALGLLDKPDTDITDWEWLHIRAAGLGGNTNSQNLLPGISDANTLMIPIENNLKLLSKLADRKKQLLVDFTPEPPVLHNSDQHAFQYIKIAWSFGDNQKHDNYQKGEAIFDIIKCRVITKGDIELLEKFLKTKRDEFS